MRYLQRVVAKQRVAQRAGSSAPVEVRIAPCSSRYFTPRSRASHACDQHHRRLSASASGLDQQLHRAVVVVSGEWLDRVVVVRIRAAGQQQRRHLGVMGDAGGAVERRLELRVLAVSQKPDFASAPPSSSAVAVWSNAGVVRLEAQILRQQR